MNQGKIKTTIKKTVEGEVVFTLADLQKWAANNIPGEAEVSPSWCSDCSNDVNPLLCGGETDRPLLHIKWTKVTEEIT